MGETGKGPEVSQPPQETIAQKIEPVDTKVEHIPTREEVDRVIEILVGAEYDVVKEEIDEWGLSRLDVETPPNEKGEVTWCGYKRGVTDDMAYKGKDVSSISIVYHENGMPVGGKTGADCVDGAWIMDPKK